MLTGIWQKCAEFQETSIALAYEQHGFFEQAQQSYETVRNLCQITFQSRGQPEQNPSF